ncbi:FAD:protein FMN transferase [Haloferula sargassicola]|uniref:FAD:protein FMN transferase n=1 Tax=Haloferula sargassicola TaxID=490096 RepID=A0ABP9URS1_9BACT
MRHFPHEAMNTTFHLRFPGEAFGAADMAIECYEALDRLEGKLSRFREDSDIGRINVMAAGETLHIAEETHACLLQAFDLHAATGGLFDISIGRAIRHRKDAETGPVPAISGQLVIHPDQAAVTCLEPGRELDLGGIGKGFALDHLAGILAQWDAPACLLSAGASTHLAYGEKAWPLELTGDADVLPIELRQAALSASGTGIQGSHIIHPDPDAPLATGRQWVIATTAAASDAWSTALILAPPEAVPELLAGFPGVTGWIEEIEGTPEPRFVGKC